MNKSELIEKIAEKADISKKKEDVVLVGFGTFTTAEREARQGRNPATGKAITISATVLPKFRPGKALKDAVKSAK